MSLREELIQLTDEQFTKHLLEIIKKYYISKEELEKRIDEKIAYYTERGGLEIIQELQNMKEMLK